MNEIDKQREELGLFALNLLVFRDKKLTQKKRAKIYAILREFKNIEEGRTPWLSKRGYPNGRMSDYYPLHRWKPRPDWRESWFKNTEKCAKKFIKDARFARSTDGKRAKK